MFSFSQDPSDKSKNIKDWTSSVMPKGQQWRERPADHIRIDPNDLRAETQYTL